MKKRRIGFRPCVKEFGPKGECYNEEIIVIKLEEVESLRLMELENLDQIACAKQMEIGRSTFQNIYKEAKRKVTDALVHGKRLVIESQIEDDVCKGQCLRKGRSNSKDHGTCKNCCRINENEKKNESEKI